MKLDGGRFHHWCFVSSLVFWVIGQTLPFLEVLDGSSGLARDPFGAEVLEKSPLHADDGFSAPRICHRSIAKNREARPRCRRNHHLIFVIGLIVTILVQKNRISERSHPQTPIIKLQYCADLERRTSAIALAIIICNLVSSQFGSVRAGLF
jgi:hypothetical protein